MIKFFALIILISSILIADVCSSSTINSLISPAKTKNDAIFLDCDLTLRKDDLIQKRIIIEGYKGSNITITCNGATIGDMTRENPPDQQIEIRSKLLKKDDAFEWEPVSNVSIVNCQINGQIRIWGMGKNGQGEYLIAPSRTSEFTKLIQQNAPRNINLKNLSVKAMKKPAVYIAPGVHGVSIVDSFIWGESSRGPVIYLDTESFGNTISGNKFNVYQEKREVIAIDGSYKNIISHNTFERIDNGGIFLYRNCGEGGVIRHSTPSENLIIDNVFYTSSKNKPAIFIGSREREAHTSFCDDDIGYDYGSSKNDKDFACNNKIVSNQFINVPENLKILIKENNCTNLIME